MKSKKLVPKKLALILNLIFVLSFSGIAQTTEFTFQGKLNVGGLPVTTPRDLRFRLWDEAQGTQIGSDVIITNVPLTNGIFTVQLDFGQQAFAGESRWIEIAVSLHGADTYTTLAPRQKITSVPFAVQALNAATAENAVSATTSSNALQLGGVAPDQYVLTSDTRMSDARNPLPGSGDYIQNQNSSQQTGDFDLNGTGKATSFDVGSHFSILGNRTLSAPGGSNLVVGFDSGQSITSGNQNVFVGLSSGAANTSGTNNIFAGFQAGQKNTIGADNSFLGVQAGRENVAGSGNTFSGRFAGFINTSGNNNSFFGLNAGSANTTGSNNTAVGAQANVGSNTRMFGTAIGSYANVLADDTIVLGKAAGTYDGVARPADTVIVPGTLNVAGTFEANVLSATTQFNIGIDQVLSVAGNQNLFVGVNAGQNNTGQGNTFVGRGAGRFNTTANNNSFFGRGAGVANTTGPNNSFFGNLAGTSNTTGASNAFFGNVAGGSNTTGQANAFFGANSGSSNQTGALNSFFGFNAGLANETGNSNAFIGHDSGSANITGQGNTFIGGASGIGNLGGNNLTLVGNLSNVAADGLQFAAAIGSNAQVSTNDTVVLGKTAGNYLGVDRPADTVHVPGIINSGTQYNLFGSRILRANGNTLSLGFSSGLTGSFNTFLGTFAGNKTTGSNNVFVGNLAGLENLSGAANTFVGDESGRNTTTGQLNTMLGTSAGLANTSGGSNVFVGRRAGASNIEGNGNTFVGTQANFGASNTTGSNNTLLGSMTVVNSGVSNSTALGYQAAVTQDNSVVLGNTGANVGIGTTAPKAKLDVTGGDIFIGGPGMGIILKSPTGNTCVKITVNDVPEFIGTVIPCP